MRRRMAKDDLETWLLVEVPRREAAVYMHTAVCLQRHVTSCWPHSVWFGSLDHQHLSSGFEPLAVSQASINLAEHPSTPESRPPALKTFPRAQVLLSSLATSHVSCLSRIQLLSQAFRPLRTAASWRPVTRAGLTSVSRLRQFLEGSFFTEPAHTSIVSTTPGSKQGLD